MSLGIMHLQIRPQARLYIAGAATRETNHGENAHLYTLFVESSRAISRPSNSLQRGYPKLQPGYCICDVTGITRSKAFERFLPNSTGLSLLQNGRQWPRHANTDSKLTGGGADLPGTSNTWQRPGIHDIAMMERCNLQYLRYTGVWGRQKKCKSRFYRAGNYGLELYPARKRRRRNGNWQPEEW